VNVLLIDDHPVIHEVLGAVARRVFDDAVIFNASSLGEAFAQAKSAQPLELAILDLGLPGCSRLDALEAFHAAYPEVRTVVFSATEDRASIMRALDVGAAGYIPKTHKTPLIMAALRLVVDGGVYIPLEALRETEPSCLVTARQLDVLRLIAEGLANKEIARRLGISNDTVKQHAKVVFAALGIEARTEARSAAERLGIKLD
jgi:DNA-binding NarL/FixJ family response regulator